MQADINELLPNLSKPETHKALREQLRGKFETVLEKAGQETLSMLALFLARLARVASGQPLK